MQCSNFTVPGPYYVSKTFLDYLVVPIIKPYHYCPVRHIPEKYNKGSVSVGIVYPLTPACRHWRIEEGGQRGLVPHPLKLVKV